MGNKNILDRLQGTKSHYSTDKWDSDFHEQRRTLNSIKENGDRYCKNPYFLHSVCTQNDAAAFHTASNPNISAYSTGLGTSRKSGRSSTKRLRSSKPPKGPLSMDYG